MGASPDWAALPTLLHTQPLRVHFPTTHCCPPVSSPTDPSEPWLLLTRSKQPGGCKGKLSHRQVVLQTPAEFDHWAWRICLWAPVHLRPPVPAGQVTSAPQIQAQDEIWHWSVEMGGHVLTPPPLKSSRMQWSWEPLCCS